MEVEDDDLPEGYIFPVGHNYGTVYQSDRINSISSFALNYVFVPGSNVAQELPISVSNCMYPFGDHVFVFLPTCCSFFFLLTVIRCGSRGDQSQELQR